MTTHGFGWASRQLKAGYKVRRTEWPLTQYLFLNGDVIYHSSTGICWSASHRSLLARDWVLFRSPTRIYERQLVRPDGTVLLNARVPEHLSFSWDLHSADYPLGDVISRCRLLPDGPWAYSNYYQYGFPGKSMPVSMAQIERIEHG